MIKKFLIVIAGFVVVVLALGAVKVAQFKEMASISHEMPASSVTSYEAKAVAWQPVISAIGTLAPVEGVTIAADADGTIVKIAAESGTAVKAGDLIIELDTSVEAPNSPRPKPAPPSPACSTTAPPNCCQEHDQPGRVRCRHRPAQSGRRQRRGAQSHHREEACARTVRGPRRHPPREPRPVRRPRPRPRCRSRSSIRSS
jgi:hypothetical protein